MSTRSHSKNSCEPSIQISWLTGNTQIGFELITSFQSCSWVCRDTPPPALKASGSSRQSTLQAISTRGFYTITCTHLLFALLKIFPRVSKNSKCTQFVSHFKDYSLIHVSGLKTYLNIFLKKTKRRYLCRETDFIKTSSKCICHDVLLKFQHQMLFLPYIQEKKKKKTLTSRKPALEGYRHPFANRLIYFQILPSLNTCLTSAKSWLLNPGAGCRGELHLSMFTYISFTGGLCQYGK